MNRSSSATTPPLWQGLWRAGVQEAPSIPLALSRRMVVPPAAELVPPEMVVFDPSEALSPAGFSFGWMLEGVVRSWRSVQPEMSSDADVLEFYCSAKELLFHAVRRAGVIDPAVGAVEFAACASNPVSVRLHGVWSCGSFRCNGDVECGACEELELERDAALGGVRAVSAAELYRLCDELFVPVPPGRLALAHALHGGCLAPASAPSVLHRLIRDRWSVQLPSLVRVLPQLASRTVSPYMLAFALADAVAVDQGLSDEELWALSPLVDSRELPTGEDVFAQLLSSVETLRAVFA